MVCGMLYHCACMVCETLYGCAVCVMLYHCIALFVSCCVTVLYGLCRVVSLYSTLCEMLFLCTMRCVRCCITVLYCV